jgi:hypothetical protein
MSDGKWPLGSKAVIPLAVLARDLAGHRFEVQLPGLRPGEAYRQLVEVTGEYDELRGELGLEVKLVKPDA